MMYNETIAMSRTSKLQNRERERVNDARWFFVKSNFFRSIFFFAIFFGSFFIFGAGQASAANMISNSEFTTNTSGWSASRATIMRVDLTTSPNVAPTGGMDNYGLSVLATSGTAQAYIDITTVVGHLYVVTARAYAPSANVGSLQAVLLISNTASGGTVSETVTLEDTWQTLVVGRIADTTATRVYLRTPTSGDSSYWDAITMQDITTGATYYVDPTVTYEGDGTATTSAGAIAGVGAFKDFNLIRGFKGDLGGTQILLKKGTTFYPDPYAVSLAILSAPAGTNWTIRTYGTGVAPVLDSTLSFTPSWVAEGNLWYTAEEAGKSYSRRFTVNGTSLAVYPNKTDLTSDTYRSWWDQTNHRHYISGGINPNSATIRANDQNVRYCFQSGSGTYNYTLQGISVKNCYDFGLYINIPVGGSNINILNNNVDSSGTRTSTGADGIQIYGGSTSTPATSVIARGNTSTNNMNNGFEIWGLDGAVFDQNIVSGNGNGFELWGYITNSTFSRNYVIDNIPTGYGPAGTMGRSLWATAADQSSCSTCGNHSGNTIEYNVLTGSKLAGILINAGTGWKIYNNIINRAVNSSADITTGAVQLRKQVSPSLTTTAELSNNIILSATDNGSSAYVGVNNSDVTLTGNNNIYYGGALYFNGTDYTSNWSGFKTATNQTASLNSNPLTISSSDYHLQPTSPAIDAGANVSLTTDYAGNNIYGAPDIGAYEYQPPYTIGTDKIDIGAGARVYANGKHRTNGTVSGTTADLTVTPQSGSAGDYSAWMDISNITWSNTGAYHKSWNASSTVSNLTNTVYTVGDLAPNEYYNVSVDNVLGSNIVGANGTNCISGVCQANTQGKIAFTYTGHYSSHTFDVQNNPPVLSSGSPNGSVLDIKITPEATLTLQTDENATCKYSPTPNTAYASMSNTFQTTGGLTHSAIITGLTGSTSYIYYIRCQDASGNPNTSDYPISFSTKAFTPVGGGISESVPSKPQVLLPLPVSNKTPLVKKEEPQIPVIASSTLQLFPQPILNPQQNQTHASTTTPLLIRAINDIKVYVVIQNKKLHIPNPIAFKRAGYNWEDIREVSKTTIENMPTITLLQKKGSPRVYKLEKSTLRWIKKASTFTRLKLRWDEIISVSQELALYPMGRNI